MEQQLSFRLGTLDQSIQLAIAGISGVLLGLLSLVISPVWTLVILVGVFIAIVAIERPELAILAVITLLSTFISEVQIPVINVGPGRIFLSDLIVMGLFILILIRWMLDPSFKLTHTPLDLPLFLFFFWSMLSTVYALLFYNLEVPRMIPEVRVISYYLLFYTITNLILKEHNLKLLIEGFFFLATIVAITVIIQYSLGVKFTFLAGRVEYLVTEGIIQENVTRITDIVGEGTLTVAFITKMIKVIISKPRFRGLFELIQSLLIGTAFIMSFNRAHWSVAILAILITIFLVRSLDRQRLVTWIYIILLLLTFLFVPIFVNPDSPAAQFISGVGDRLVSIVGQKTLLGPADESTLAWREVEYKYAFPQIWSHPILGLGLGARYRPRLVNVDHQRFDGTFYIHNGHVWIMMKTGLVGYFFLMWLCILTIWRGFKYWQRIPGPQIRGYFLGFTLSFLGLVIIAILHFSFVALFWAPIIPLMMGVNEVMIKQSVPNQKQAEH
ncbi:MAG: O-antigen ligase family protein [Anaerolineales bacterium]|nr:O-antigen ligase family protein [Anaerolineales bacterium]